MSKTSAGILLYRKAKQTIEVLLVHPGGPFWKNKDEGAWTIPKGEAHADEDLLATAIREFYEETGISVSGNLIELKPVKQKSGKLVCAWAVEGDMDADNIKSNSFEIELFILLLPVSNNYYNKSTNNEYDVRLHDCHILKILIKIFHKRANEQAIPQ